MSALSRLDERARAPERLLLGLMSGMSMDGLDLALVRVRGGPPDDERPEVELVASETRTYDDELREGLLAARGGSAESAAELDRALAERWGAMVGSFLERTDVGPEDVAAIGSHGQTLFHRPRADARPAATLQVGSASVLAAVTGVPVVADFRPADIAAGGEGAPLIPLVDWLLYGEPERVVACHNLGNIANVTVLPAAREDVLAFDTGPANALLDAVASADEVGRAAGGFDRDGSLSAAGAVDDDLLLALYSKRSAWIATPPPKSAGYGTFGDGLLREVAEPLGSASFADRMRTVVEYTALLLRDAYAWHVVTRHPELELVRFSGGGCRNPTLMARIRDLLGRLDLDVEVLPDPWADMKEAVGFALLADRTLRGLPGNVPSATGASRPVVLGSVALP